jgi:hypothetical protein
MKRNTVAEWASLILAVLCLIFVLEAASLKRRLFVAEAELAEAGINIDESKRQALGTKLVLEALRMILTNRSDR